MVLEKNKFFSNYIDIKFVFILQNRFVIFLKICFILWNHKNMLLMFQGNIIGASHITKCAKLVYTSVLLIRKNM